MGLVMRTKIIYSFLLTLSIGLSGVPITSNASTLLLPAPTQHNGVDLVTSERVVMGPSCYGRTDFPHESHHVPNTVNVIAATVCPGHQVTVSTRLWRSHYILFATTNVKSASGISSIMVNDWLPCIWVKQHEPIHYAAESTHIVDHYRVAFTKQEVTLNC